MKKLKYLFIVVLVSILGIDLVCAAGNPNFNISVTPTVNSDKTINIEVVVKNDGTSTYGMKQGYVYVTMNESQVEAFTNMTGVYREYNEVTGQYTDKNVFCNNEGSTGRKFKCVFGKDISGNVSYSGPKDELVITFATKLCEASTDCDIVVEVEGEVVDPDNSYASISNGVTKLATKNAGCDVPSNPDTPTTPENPETPTTPDEPTENPNTVDNGVLYMLVGALSLVLIATVLTAKKRRYV